jgi:hypothetical protein
MVWTVDKSFGKQRQETWDVGKGLDLYFNHLTSYFTCSLECVKRKKTITMAREKRYARLQI